MHAEEFMIGDVPGILWTGSGPGPLVLLGHGGGTGRRAPAMAGRAERLVAAGFRAVSVDAPGHGDRPRTQADEEAVPRMHEAMAKGEPVGHIVEEYNADIARRAVPEWQAVLDELGADEVGYYGINMGTAIGVPLIVAEPRIKASVLGQFWLTSLEAQARQIWIPIEFHLQWDDEHIPRDEGLRLFDAFASEQKTLHANAGRHKELPRFEADSAVAFFARHLT